LQINKNIYYLAISLVFGTALFSPFIINSEIESQTLHNRTLPELANKISAIDEDPKIAVGNIPNSIAVEAFDFNTVYVANGGSNSISVISGENNSRIKDIRVGEEPRAIGINEMTNTIYVVNSESDSVSVIDGTDNNVVAGITFNVNPFNSGYIQCDKFISPISQFLYIRSGTECKAIPNKGFEFLSWEENLAKNSTQLINVSKAATPLESFLDLINIKTEEPESTLNITRFGSFTANFKELPPPLPSEYWATLFGFILTTGLGAWLIPSLVRWTRTRADTKKSDYYYKRIKSLYDDDDNLDENDLAELDKLKTEITDAHSKGKVNELHYNSLKNEISIRYDKIFRKRIHFIINSYDRNISEQLNKLKEDIEIAHSEQKITELQFNLLNKKMQEIDNHGK
jgi:YVTN family beta-propeller protein